MWIGGGVGGGDPAHGARRHRLAGRARDAGGGRARSSPPSSAAPAEAGRSIDDDHYGASFPFYFGSAADPAVQRAMEAYEKRTGRNPAGYFAVGDAEAIVERIAEYIDAGVSKFVLRPVGAGDEAVLAQTRRLIEEVLPLAAARWPKPPKQTA